MIVVTPPVPPRIGLTALRPSPAGMPNPEIAPPNVAEAGDPFASLRIVDLLATIPRGRQVRIDDIVDALNARYLDWLFSQTVVVGALVSLQANWMADYRNGAGFELEDGDYGPTVFLEESPRVDPWIVSQAQRLAGACRESLREFARRDRVTADG